MSQRGPTAPGARFQDRMEMTNGIERLALAIVFHFSLTDSDHLALLGLFFRRVGDDDSADLLLAFLDALEDDAVV